MFVDLSKYFNPKNPLFRFFMFLSLFGLVSTADLLLSTTNPVERGGYIIKSISALFMSGAVYYMVRYGFGLTMSNPLNFFVSSWIIYLLIHPTTSIWYSMAAIIFLTLEKSILKKNNQPIFNPAALAIALTYGLSVVVSKYMGNDDTLLVSWWGADMFQNITNSIPVISFIVPLFFLFGFVYFANAFKKTNYVLSFFITYLTVMFVYTFINESMSTALSLASTMLFNSTVFCAFVMLAEPKTAPLFPKQQIIVGVVSGVVLFIMNIWLGFLPIDTMINTILFANLMSFVIKLHPRRVQSSPAVTPNV